VLLDSLDVFVFLEVGVRLSLNEFVLLLEPVPESTPEFLPCWSSFVYLSRLSILLSYFVCGVFLVLFISFE